MSRSYRKPVIVDSYGSKTKHISKRLANKKARKTILPLKGNQYKKCFNSYDIVDWKCDLRFCGLDFKEYDIKLYSRK